MGLFAASEIVNPESLTIPALIAMGLVAFMGGYFAALAKRLVAAQSFQQVLRETKETKELVARVELAMSQAKVIEETELAYRERQLAEFYGPIYGAVKSTGRLWKLWAGGRLDPIGREVLEYFRRQNELIVEILKTKFYLVEGDQIPESFSSYLTSVMIFNIGPRVGNGYTPQVVADLPEAAFPEEFFTYIITTTEQLKRNLAQLYAEHKFVIRGATETKMAKPRLPHPSQQ
jgi:hypothetical protein